MLKNTKCPVCGGEIRTVNRKGERSPYRDMPDMEITEDLWLPRCSACGESWLDSEMTSRLEAALAKSYEALRQREVAEILEALHYEHGLRQIDVERVLGVSAGYMSKVKRGEKSLAPSTFRLLYLLRAEPGVVVSTLGELDPVLADRAGAVEPYAAARRK